MVRSVTPFVEGFPGLPKWLDGPYVKRLAVLWDVSYKQASARIRAEEEKDDD